MINDTAAVSLSGLPELPNRAGWVWDDSVFMQISESQVGRCIRTKKWKYSVRVDADGWAAPSAETYFEEYLYDLENDPHEMNNLVADPRYASARAALAVKLIKRMAQAGEVPPTILPVKSPIK